MTRATRSLVTAASTALVLSFADFASAANITWGLVSRVTSPADLIQTGTFVTAVNMGANDGVLLPIAGTDIIFHDGILTQAIGGSFAVTNSGYHDLFYDPSTGEANLDRVLDSHSYRPLHNPNGRARVDLTGLTPGTPYLLQVIGIADTRTCCSDRIQTVDDGAGNISGDLQRGLANYVIGTFTADTATQSFFVSGTNDPGLSGLVLRAIPEPTSIIFLTLAAGASLLRRRGRNA